MNTSNIKAQRSLIATKKLYNYLQSGFPELDPNTNVLKNRPEINKLYEKFLNANTKISIDLDHNALAMMKQKYSNKWKDKQMQGAKYIVDKAQSKLAEKELQKRRKKCEKIRKYIKFQTHDQNPETYLQTYRKFLEEAAKVKADQSQQQLKFVQEQLSGEKQSDNTYTESPSLKIKLKTEQNYNSQKSKNSEKKRQGKNFRARTQNHSRQKTTFITSTGDRSDQTRTQPTLQNTVPLGICKQRYQMLKKHPVIIAYTLQRIKKAHQKQLLPQNTIVKPKPFKAKRKLINFTLDPGRHRSQLTTDQLSQPKTIKNNQRILIQHHIQKIYSGRNNDQSGRNKSMRRQMQREIKIKQRQKGQLSRMNQKCLDVKIQSNIFQGLKKIQKIVFVDQLKNIGVHFQETTQRKRIAKSLDN